MSDRLTIERWKGDDEVWERAGHSWRLVHEGADRTTALAEVLRDLESIAAIGGDPSLRDEVLGELPIIEWSGEPIDVCGTLYGCFGDIGWLEFEEAGWRPPLPVCARILIDLDWTESGGFTSGSVETFVGEIRPGLLLTYWNSDGMDRDFFVSEVDPADYAADVLATARSFGTLPEYLGPMIERGFAEGGGSWNGDELWEDGSSTALLSMTLDPLFRGLEIPPEE